MEGQDRTIPALALTFASRRRAGENRRRKAHLRRVFTMYKSILVHVDPTAMADERLRVAADLARRAGGRLIAIGAQSPRDVIDPGNGYLDSGTVQALQDALTEALDDAERRARAAAGDLPFVWRGWRAAPVPTMAAEARGADLVIASPAPRHVDRTLIASAGDLIMTTGLPVLVVPPGAKTVMSRRAVVGWKNTAQSRAAVGAALPWLQAAEQVLLLRVTGGDESGAPAELADVAERLRLHGVKVETALMRKSGAVSEDLLQRTRELDADVLVVGAYAHSRASEWMFGGVTRDLITGASIPVLFCR